MTSKEIINDYFVPAIVCWFVSSANSIKVTLLQINNISVHKYDYIIDNVIHIGTAFSVVLGCFYLIVKIWLAIKHKKV